MRRMSGIANMSERVRDALKASGLSYREIGRRAKVSNDTVRNFLLNGTAKVETVAKFEAAFSGEMTLTANNSQAGSVHV